MVEKGAALALVVDPVVLELRVLDHVHTAVADPHVHVLVVAVGAYS